MAAFGVGCGVPSDDVSLVHDLRILGVTADPPELMTPDCASFDNPPDNLFDAPGTFRALLADPLGAGRNLDYDLKACVSQSDTRCDQDPDQTVAITSGSMPAGDWSFPLSPGELTLADGSRLWKKALASALDSGQAGFWLPIVLHVKAGTEEIFAQKLMVLSCHTYSDSAANTNPDLPDLLRNGEVWAPDDHTPFADDLTLELAPFDDRREHYVEPDINLKPVELDETWRISWFTTLGGFTPVSADGAIGTVDDPKRHAKWESTDTVPTPNVQFWVVVRDGRGGMSWLSRSADHIAPPPATP